jgi:hypothetical protein
MLDGDDKGFRSLLDNGIEVCLERKDWMTILWDKIFGDRSEFYSTSST